MLSNSLREGEKFGHAKVATLRILTIVEGAIPNQDFTLLWPTLTRSQV